MMSPVVTPVGVVASMPVQAASSYTVAAVVPSPVLDSPSSAARSDVDTALGPIPGVVDALARSITAGQTSPLDKAEALTDFFRSGQFHYRITTTQAVGVDPLVSFLTQTRSGSCEQFAGAFAVLARASGLATRVAVGFTPGRPSNGETVVRGSDAHAWPQVLIDNSWVSFEPTPQLPSGELSPPGVLGPSGLGHPNPVGPGSQPHVSIPVVTTPTPNTPVPAVPNHVATRGDRAGITWIVLLFLATIVATGIVTRRRTRRTQIDRVVAAWTTIDHALARRGFTRPIWRTPMGHVHVLLGSALSEQARATLGDMATVAALLQNVTYGSSDASAAEVVHAEQASRRARRAILAGMLRGSADHDLGSVRLPYVSTDSQSD
jgi:transglutaminase-like putative cysteine protease